MTGNDIMSYIYRIPNFYLEDSLDFFGELLKEPAFDKEVFAKEVNAVNSEHVNNMKKETRITYELLKALTAADHPFHIFQTGNLMSLRDVPEEKGIDVHKEMRRLFSKYHVAGRMKLLVIANHELGVMEEWAEKYFHAIPAVREFEDDDEDDDAIELLEVRAEAGEEEEVLAFPAGL